MRSSDSRRGEGDAGLSRHVSTAFPFPPPPSGAELYNAGQSITPIFLLRRTTSAVSTERVAQRYKQSKAVETNNQCITCNLYMLRTGPATPAHHPVPSLLCIRIETRK